MQDFLAEGLIVSAWSSLAYYQVLAGLAAVFVVLWLLYHSLRDLFWGLQATVFLSVVTIPIVGSYFVGGGSFWIIQVWQIMLGLTAVSFFFRVLAKGTVHGPTFLCLPLTLFLLAHLISLINSNLVVDSLRQLLKVILVNAMIYVIVINLVDSLGKAERLMRIIFASAVLVFLAGMAQLASFHLLGLPMNYSQGDIALRATATFTEVGWFPAYLSYVLAIYLPYCASRSAVGVRGLTFLAILVVGIVIGMGRGPWIAAAVTLLSYMIIGKITCAVGRAKVMAYIGLIVVIVGIVGLVALPNLFDGIQPRFLQLFGIGESPGEFDSMETRLMYFKAEWEFIQEHPFIGNGIGTWSGNVLPASGVEMVDETMLRGGSSFNIFMGVLYDMGLLGASAFGWLLCLYFGRVFKLAGRIQGEQEKRCLQAAFLLMISILVNSLFNPIYLAGFAMIGFSLGVAILSLLRKQLSVNNVESLYEPPLTMRPTL